MQRCHLLLIIQASIPANNFVIFGTVDSLKEKATQIIADREKVGA